MKGTGLKEPDDPSDMRLHNFLHRPVETTQGTFMIYTCPHEDHPNCVILAGREYDPNTDSDDGVYYHAYAGCVKRNIVGERYNWELTEMDAPLSPVHGPDGVGRHFKVQSRMEDIQ